MCLFEPKDLSIVDPGIPPDAICSLAALQLSKSHVSADTAKTLDECRDNHELRLSEGMNSRVGVTVAPERNQSNHWAEQLMLKA